MELTWDKAKKAINLAKHGLAFEDAIHVFNGETVTFVDDRFNYGEVRYITLGMLASRAVLIVHTLRDDAIRLISMRKANEKERTVYQERLKTTR